jgi:hypothetical protein
MLAPKIKNKLAYHHTGVVVRLMTYARENYVQLFGGAALSSVFAIAWREVNVCFVQVWPGAFLELGESHSDSSRIASLARTRQTYYHVAYETTDIESAVTEFGSDRFRAIGTYE